MKLQFRFHRYGIALGVALGSVVYAQSTSVLLGTVTDAASGAKLKDAVVTATSPASQAPQIAITDSSGYYRLPALPPGRYTIRVEKEGYRPFSRNDIEVSIDRQYRVNIAAQPESMSSEEITISGLPPIIDIGTANQGMVMNSKFMDRVPVVSYYGPANFDAVAALAPQTQSHSGGLYMSISGGSAPENGYSVDGISVRDIGTGLNSGVVPMAFIEQTNVVTGGFQAELGGTTGGAIRAVTRTGSNEFQGEVKVDYTPGAIFPMPKAYRSNGSAYVYQRLPWNTVDISATLGGPIVKDKIWFFAGFSPRRTRAQDRQWIQAFKLNEAGDGYLKDSNGQYQYTNIEGSRITSFADETHLPFIAKLTFLLAPEHTLTLNYNGAYVGRSDERGLTPRGPPEYIKWNGGGSDYNFTNTLMLQYQGSFLDKKLLAEARVGWFRFAQGYGYSDGSTNDDTPPGSATGTPQMNAYFLNSNGVRIGYNDVPWLSSQYDAATRARIAAACQPSIVGTKKLQRCPVQSIRMGGTGRLGGTVSDSIQATMSLTYLLQLLGHHVWKAGFDYEWLRLQTTQGFSGAQRIEDNIDDPRYVTVQTAYGYLTGPDKVMIVKNYTTETSTHKIAWYLQDSWSIMDKVTLNAGLRYDNQQLLSNDGSVGIAFNNQLSPRVSVIWDPTQQGRSKIFASYGRYFESVPLILGSKLLNGEPEYKLANSPRSQGCDPLQNFNSLYTNCPGGSREVLVNILDNPRLSRKYQLPGITTARVDPSLQPQSSDEVTAGAEYEVFRDARLAARYTRRWMNTVVEDVSFDDGVSKVITNPGYGLASNFPKAVRNYNAVSAEFTKSFSTGWLTQASYTWTTLTGNYEGLASESYGQLNEANTTQAFDTLVLLKNANGRLPGSLTHTIKLFGGKEFPIGKRFSLGLFLTYTGSSGEPISYLGSNVRYGLGTVNMLPMGSGGDAPWTHRLDLMVSANVKIKGEMNLQFRIDVRNFINLQGVAAVDQLFTYSSITPYTTPKGSNPQVAACISGKNDPACTAAALPVKQPDGTNLPRSEINPNFKLPTAYQSPFTARFVIKMTF